ncbi:Lambda phage tail tape-measure protein (Tape_meas_lam_C) [Sphingomonas sp. YR710]|uniref:phage tail tape measure C-terminal domain-containing protein n=1 Tax=Sphingomonas sp. YR710 TaxID=1882773 RepID=UPI000886449C|nr:phage tail tape measure C-terminal domain-containing protein [Sphingomonas sp. YR710]SDC31069.1 Lambda phage tail tape-measure protein (Tape_meas_lam_C) [Sphingomonas sp. YR710]
MAAIDAGLVLRLEATTALLQQQLRQAANDVDGYAGKVVPKLDQVANTFKRGGDTIVVSAKQQQQAMKNVGFQVGDFFTQVQLGQGVIRAFISQAGQLAGAMADLGGKVGAVGRFFSGMAGAGILVAVSALAQYVEKMFEADTAADKATGSADAFADAQSKLAPLIDTTTQALKTHNIYLAENIRLQAQQDLKAAKKAQQDATGGVQGIRTTLPLAFGRGGAVGAANTGALAGMVFGGGVSGGLTELKTKVLNGAFDLKDGGLDVKSIRLELEALEKQGRTAGQMAADLTPKFMALAKAREEVLSNQAIITAIDSGVIDPRLVPYKRPPKARKGKEYTALDLWVQSFTSFETYDKWLEETKKQGEASLKQTDIARFKIGDVDAPGITEGSGRFENSIVPRGNTDSLLNDNQGEIEKALKGNPLQQFGDQLDFESRHITEAFQSIEVDGLNSLTNGITDAITGAKSLGDAFKHVANQIIADLIRIAVRQAIIKPLASALGFGGGGLPGFANGGDPPVGMPFLVGERGPEILMSKAPTTVIPNHRLNMMGGGGQSISVTVDARNATDPAMVEAAAYRAVYASAPVLLAAAQGRTTAALQRPNLAYSG